MPEAARRRWEHFRQEVLLSELTVTRLERIAWVPAGFARRLRCHQMPGEGEDLSSTRSCCPCAAGTHRAVYSTPCRVVGDDPRFPSRFGLRDTQTGSRWISDGTVADLIVPRLIGDGHPPGSEGDSVRLAMWPVALVLAPVACAPTN